MNSQLSGLAMAAALAVALTPTINSPSAVASHAQSVSNSAPEVARTCCKICRKGKACGNSCIARDRNCHQPPGCACDGFENRSLSPPSVR